MTTKPSIEHLSVTHILMLTLPAEKPGDYPCITFAMDSTMLRVAYDPKGERASFIKLFDRHGHERYSISPNHPDWRSALVNVGRFLADNPSY